MDTDGVRAVAAEFDATASRLEGVLRSLGGLSFSGVSAGQAHADKGNAIHAGLHEFAAGIAEWSRAHTEIAHALRTAADNFTAVSERGAQGFGALDV